VIDYQVYEFEENTASAKVMSVTPSRQRDCSSEWMHCMDEGLEVVQETIRLKIGELKNQLKVVAILEERLLSIGRNI
jgi:hypothetical protein